MPTDRKTFAAGIGAAGLLMLGLYLAVPAAADNPSPKSSPSATTHRDKDHPREQKGHPHRWTRLFRGVHGEATVRHKDGFRLTTWQHGKITAVSSSTLTVRSVDGTSWTWTTNDQTRVRENGTKAELEALKNGTQVLVAGDRSTTTRTARLVRLPKAH